LYTGDKARIEDGYIYITGRIKDIIVMATGEKVSPVDMELAVCNDVLFDQVMVIGEGRPYLTALVVLNEGQWERFIEKNNHPDANTVESLLRERIGSCLHDFPGYAEIVRLSIIQEPWTIENDLMTPTLKIKRNRIEDKYAGIIHRMYEGHEV
jgi:long-chain acyl-CoA synthetase